MKTASAKAKGRTLQKWVRDKVLLRFRSLEPDDIRSTGMGQTGQDLQLSPAARKLFPYSVECKSHKAFAVYTFYDQAQDNSDGLEPLVVIKANHKKPLVIVDAEHFFGLLNDIR